MQTNEAKSVEFQISQIEYVAASKLHARLSSKMKLFFIVVFTLLGLASFYTNDISLRGIAQGGFVGGLIALIPLRLFLVPFIARSQYRSYKAIQEPVSLTFQENGLFFKTENAQALVKWDSLIYWKESEQLLIAYLAPRLYYIIPCHIEKEGFPLEKLRKTLEENLGESS